MKALLKKSELKVTALGDKVDKISKENIELTKMCDELIEKFWIFTNRNAILLLQSRICIELLMTM